MTCTQVFVPLLNVSSSQRSRLPAVSTAVCMRICECECVSHLLVPINLFWPKVNAESGERVCQQPIFVFKFRQTRIVLEWRQINKRSAKDKKKTTTTTHNRNKNTSPLSYLCIYWSGGGGRRRRRNVSNLCIWQFIFFKINLKVQWLPISSFHVRPLMH